MIINCVVFLISVATCLLIVYGNITKFCVLILYPVTLLMSLSSMSCFGRFLGLFFVIYKLDSFISFLPIYMSFIFFFVLARTSTTILSKNGQSGHFFFID